MEMKITTATVDITRLTVDKLMKILETERRKERPDHVLIKRLQREIDRKSMQTWY